MAKNKKIVIIAGPNGAGKTTFAREFLPTELDITAFVNADFIASGLSPFKPEAAAIKAGKLMLLEIREHVLRGCSFGLETTLSGRRYRTHIVNWQQQGYLVKLVFLQLPNVDIAIRRVQTRIQQGGHAIPEPVIRRRFKAGWENFQELYRPLVNTWAIYDNSGLLPVLIDEGNNT